jgi:hypothetical protein
MISIIAVSNRKIKPADLKEPNATFRNGSVYWLWDSITCNYMKCSHSELVNVMLSYKDSISNARLVDDNRDNEIRILSGIMTTFVKTSAAYVDRDGSIVIADKFKRKISTACYKLGISIDNLLISDYYVEPQEYTGSLLSCDLECGLIGEVRKEGASEIGLEEKTDDSTTNFNGTESSEAMVEKKVEGSEVLVSSESKLDNTSENHSTAGGGESLVESAVGDSHCNVCGSIERPSDKALYTESNNKNSGGSADSDGAVLSVEESSVNAGDANENEVAYTAGKDTNLEDDSVLQHTDGSITCSDTPETDAEELNESEEATDAEDSKHFNVEDELGTEDTSINMGGLAGRTNLSDYASTEDEETTSEENEQEAIQEDIEHKSESSYDNNIADVRISNEIKEHFTRAVESDYEDSDISAEMMLANEIDNGIENEFELQCGLPDCELCHGAGYYTGDFGIKIRCNCTSKRNKSIVNAKEALSRAKSLTSGETAKDLVTLGVIKKSRMSDYYNKDYTERFIENLLNTFDGCISPKSSRDKFYDTVNKLIVDMRGGKLPSHSYFISAPNGCGKETLANTLIKLAYSNNMRVVPYKSLIELTDLKNEYIGKVKDRKELIDPCTYSFSDYVDADLVCCYMASGDPRVTANAMKADDIVINEFSTLETLLKLRAYRDKPTLIFSDRRIMVYRAIRGIDSSFMYNMYTSDERFASMDRFSETLLLFGMRKKQQRSE